MQSDFFFHSGLETVGKYRLFGGYNVFSCSFALNIWFTLNIVCRLLKSSLLHLHVAQCFWQCLYINISQLYALKFSSYYVYNAPLIFTLFPD